MSELQQSLFPDEEFETLLTGLPTLLGDQKKAEFCYQEHLWAWVLLVEERLTKHGIDNPQLIAAEIIATIGDLHGGNYRYLPRGEKVRNELRDIHIFRLWHEQSVPAQMIWKQYYPKVSISTIERAIADKKSEYLKLVQRDLLEKQE